IPLAEPEGDPDGDLLIVAWGSTHGAITAAVKAQREGLDGRKRIGHLHLRHLNPLPSNVGEILKRYKKVLVPELNMGQLSCVLRAGHSSLPDRAIARDHSDVISGIGCSSRFPYYLHRRGRHTSHGRPHVVASRWQTARPDLDV